MDIINFFENIRDIPYRIPLTLEEEDNCCSGKMKRLKAILEKYGYTVRYRVCAFRWSDMHLPVSVTDIPHDNDSTHVYLELFLDNVWINVDPTWDRWLCEIFSIANWDGVSSTPIAVTPVSLFSEAESRKIMEEWDPKEAEWDLVINGAFYKAFNEYLEKNRKTMNLLLTSTGISGEKLRMLFAEKLSSLIGGRVALIFTVRVPEDVQWIGYYHDELDSLGVRYEDVNISEERDLSDIGPYDGYYVCGGNTFYILDRLRKTGLMKLMKDEIGKGKSYIGVSAGSVIVGPDIEIAGWGANGDENDIELSDLSGMGMTDMVTFPHYTAENEQEVLDFEAQRGLKVERIADGDGIFIDTSQGSGREK